MTVTTYQQTRRREKDQAEMIIVLPSVSHQPRSTPAKSCWAAGQALGRWVRRCRCAAAAAAACWAPRWPCACRARRRPHCSTAASLGGASFDDLFLLFPL